MLAVLITSKDYEAGEALGRIMTDTVSALCACEEVYQKAQLIGPAEASISRINDIYRHVFYVKHEDYQVLVEIKDMLESFCKDRELRNQAVQYDFDPINTY